MIDNKIHPIILHCLRYSAESWPETRHFICNNLWNRPTRNTFYTTANKHNTSFGTQASLKVRFCWCRHNDSTPLFMLYHRPVTKRHWRWTGSGSAEKSRLLEEDMSDAIARMVMHHWLPHQTIVVCREHSHHKGNQFVDFLIVSIHSKRGSINVWTPNSIDFMWSLNSLHHRICISVNC